MPKNDDDDDDDADAADHRWRGRMVFPARRGCHVGTFSFIFSRSRSRCFVRRPLRWVNDGLLGLFSLAKTKPYRWRCAWPARGLDPGGFVWLSGVEIAGWRHGRELSCVAGTAALIRPRPGASSVLPARASQACCGRNAFSVPSAE